jgi:uncharacterized protein YfaS (alpha-2-macroglobulin family)
LAEWLFQRFDSGWEIDEAWSIVGFRSYLAASPESKWSGSANVSFNGTPVKAIPPKVGDWVEAVVPATALKTGANTVEIQSRGTYRAVVDARVYRPMEHENMRGIRVIRRYEIRNPAGSWVESTGTFHTGEPVRCTVVVWGDSVEDAIRVTEPIPAGFEYLDDDYMGTYGRQEVRDGAVVHYVMAGGEPLVFRYYIRAEAEGGLTALPAVAEVLRRPSNRGNSATLKMEVKKG